MEQDKAILKILNLPLEKVCLIEASAGTGKTYTMVSLYLRLILGVGIAPLSVEQILVVTFTKSATQELRERIRERLIDTFNYFETYHKTQNCPELENDGYLWGLYQAVENDIKSALLRLQIAQYNIDLASIYTIHGFCQRILSQYAFDSALSFEFELNSDETDLLNFLSHKVWREKFYPMTFSEAKIVSTVLGSPVKALEAVKPYLSGILPPLTAEQNWINTSFSDYYFEFHCFIAQFKQHWRDCRQEINDVINAELNRKYHKNEKKALNRRSYQLERVSNWSEDVDQWVAEKEMLALPTKSFLRFCQSVLIANAEEGAEHFVTSDKFVKNEEYLTAYEKHSQRLKSLLYYQYLIAMREALSDYKRDHKEKGFGDMLSLLCQALQGKNGTDLADLVRQSYPFAMIDEFQDTDEEQYAIFSRLFMQSSPLNKGFIMIGDPKQSIYKFRGADIFTYLHAVKQVDYRETLNINWRSLPDVVNGINQIFSFSNLDKCSPFLHHLIQFEPVEAKLNHIQLVGEKSFCCYLQHEFDEKLAAQMCAEQIAQQLKKIVEQKLYLKKGTQIELLKPQDIAILVRKGDQAKLIKTALAERNIPSVYLSEKSSVFASIEAHDLIRILRACLSPSDQRLLRSCVGCAVWGLNATEIFQLTHNENEWDNLVSRFTLYHQIWQYQGILPMLHKLFLQEKIIERMAVRPNADRRITDLLHLAELLQEASTNLGGEQGLLNWFEYQLRFPNERKDEQKLRLESEEELIKIVTIHASKGLEYPVVWLPFVTETYGEKNEASGKKDKMLFLYRNQHDQLHWGLGDDDQKIREFAKQQEQAEDLRLLYVALTRAKYQINFIMPTHIEKEWNAFCYLLTDGYTNHTATTTEAFQLKEIDAEFIDLSENMQSNITLVSLPAPSSPAKTVREFCGNIPQNQCVTSFSAIANANQKQQYEMVNSTLSFLTDFDYQSSFHATNECGESLTPFTFPHSLKVGNVLHQFLEHCDFIRPLEYQTIIQLCDQLNLKEEWHQIVYQWIEKILTTPFSPAQIQLRTIAKDKRITEWDFYLRLANPKGLLALNTVIKKYSHLGLGEMPDLQIDELEGYVRGVIDCIIFHQEKYYIIDYKSNFLGDHISDYSVEKLTQTIRHYRYDLQYLLYTLAFHRYMRFRLGNSYHYERDFGGVAYLFLRAMNGYENSGIYFDKPNPALIEEMDHLFG